MSSSATSSLCWSSLSPTWWRPLSWSLSLPSSTSRRSPSCCDALSKDLSPASLPWLRPLHRRQECPPGHLHLQDHLQVHGRGRRGLRTRIWTRELENSGYCKRLASVERNLFNLLETRWWRVRRRNKEGNEETEELDQQGFHQDQT